MKYKFEQTFMLGCKKIREEVFIKEQGFQNEFDDLDNKAYHLLLFIDKEPVATGRMYQKADEKSTYILGRIAVLKAYRNSQLGKKVLSILEEKAKDMGGSKIMLSAQMQAQGFYEKYGYKISGEIFYDEGCPHIPMEKSIA